MRIKHIYTILIVYMGFAGMIPMDSIHAQPYFEEVTQSSGIDPVGCGCNFGDQGVSTADFNNDGWPDITMTSPAGDSIYFIENNQGVFNRVLLPIDFTGNTKMVLWVDLDNDGDRDLLVAGYEEPNKLYRCDTPGVAYTDVTAQSGLLQLDDRSSGLAAGDMNNDGLLDLFIANQTIQEHSNQFYINQGGLVFEEKSDEWGYDEPIHQSFLHVIVDFDRDGYQDVYTVNDRYSVPNYLYRNIDGTHFADSTDGSGADVFIDAMDGGIGDYNEDGFMDVYISNIPLGNVLLKNNGDFSFADVTEETGVGFYRVGWGGTFFDIENDKDMDLHAVCSGSTSDNPNAMYINQYPPEYEYIEHNIEGDTGSTQSDAIFDFDDDGRMDLLVMSHLADRPQIFHNITDNDNHWVKINLKGTESNTEAVGTQLVLHSGDRMMSNYMNCGESFRTQLPFTEHFGLGADTLVDSLILYWPSGNVDRYYGLAADSTYYFIEDTTGTDSVEVSGTIELQSDMPLNEVEVGISGDFTDSVSTNMTGQYSFNCPSGDSISLTPYKDEQWSEGVSTVDLIEIQLHLLGINDLDSPYEIIAADANADDDLSTLDLVILQLIILGINNDVDGNTSYRFVPSDYVFQNPEDPLQENFPESKSIQVGNSNTVIDFEAIKVGDVNY